MRANAIAVLLTVAMLFMLPWSTLQAATPCEGNYRHGGKPGREELAAVLAAHVQWLDANTSMEENVLSRRINGYDTTNMAKLCNADLANADLRHARLSGADLRGANLRGADLRLANLLEADLSGADLRGAKLGDAFLVDSKLTDADLADADLRYAYLSDADMSGANLARARFALHDIKLARHRIRLTKMESLSNARNLSHIRIDPSLFTASQFVMLREEFKRNGKRDQERAITAALKRMEARQAGWLERSLSFVAFDLTTGYGASPGQALAILGFLIVVFAVPYMFALRNDAGGGIWKTWPADRVQRHLGHDDPARLNLNGVRALGVAFYFSVLSAASIGWRELNFGNWITRMQPDEYVLRATGWVRSVSGIQSLISVYLLALWVLTYFGRPFE